MLSVVNVLNFNVSFRAGQANQSFRGGSPNRNAQPSLADLEFPPPPSDLPPPPEEYDSEIIEEVIKNSPLLNRKVESKVETEISAEEAGSRFGISLRHREPSTDSCSSAKSKNDIENNLISPNCETKSSVSIESDVPNIGSPLEPLPPPPSFPSSNEEDQPKTLSMKEMLELKLVAEIKERADSKSKNSKEPSPNESLNLTSITHDPISQLVSELSETMNIEKKSTKIENEVKPLKSNLKKVEVKVKKDEIINNTTSGVIDFKSRLRKVENDKDKKTENKNDETNNENKESTNNDIEKIIVTDVETEREGNKRESTASSDSGKSIFLITYTLL